MYHEFILENGLFCVFNPLVTHNTEMIFMV